jgi:hypothetical protein
VHAFLTSALDGGEWQAHAAAALPREKDPRYPLNWRLVGPHTRSGRAEDDKNSLKGPSFFVSLWFCLLRFKGYTVR